MPPRRWRLSRRSDRPGETDSNRYGVHHAVEQTIPQNLGCPADSRRGAHRCCLRGALGPLVAQRDRRQGRREDRRRRLARRRRRWRGRRSGGGCRPLWPARRRCRGRRRRGGRWPAWRCRRRRRRGGCRRPLRRVVVGERYESHEGWKTAAGVAAGVATGIAIGTMLSRPPAASTTVVVSGTNYTYSDGVYYARVISDGAIAYQVVPAPAGAVIATLPRGCSSVRVGGVAYTQCGPTYYHRVSTGYQVVVVR
jgi:Family of unknown function (DUF6515)